jgi:uncharacterized protein (DUF433 family)
MAPTSLEWTEYYRLVSIGLLWYNRVGCRSNRAFVEAYMAFRRITIDPEKMGGVPCIRDLRMPVATVVAMVAEGMTEDEILAAHPNLEREDIRAALRYAAV